MKKNKRTKVTLIVFLAIIFAAGVYDAWQYAHDKAAQADTEQVDL